MYGVHRQWNDLFEELKVKTYQVKNLYPAKYPSKNERQTKTYSNVQKLRVLDANRSIPHTHKFQNDRILDKKSI